VTAVFTHWSASWPALGCYAVVAVAHLAGLRLAAANGITGRERARAAMAFQAGLLLALLCLVSPIGYWSDIYLWVRAVQFILLAVGATGLMVLGAPWQALGQAIRPRSGGAGQPREQHVPGMQGPDNRPLWLLRRPAAAITAVNVVWFGWQLPVLYDSAQHNSAVALAGHASCLAAGLVFWLQLIGSRPLAPLAPPLRRLKLVVASVGTTTIFGMVLVFGNGVLYPAYANHWHHLMTVLDDQQLSGAVLWMGMLPALIIVAVSLLMSWLSEEESAELSAGLDRLLTPRKSAWSARPGIR
jgi:cytochrome c oxidase assembly factor CtaG